MNVDKKNTQSLTCDTVKIKANYKYLLKTICRFNDTYNSQSGIKTGIYYSSKDDAAIPFNIYVAVSYPKQTLTIEFSSKILFDDYPLLISQHTIRQCLENINSLNICEIDVEGILCNACFTKLAVTVDKQFDLTENALNSLNSMVSNYRRFKWTHYDGEGITFTKDVKSKDCKESITLYNKEKELIASAQNRQFLGMLRDEEKVKEYFCGKTRFEIVLNTQQKIKTYLEIDDTLISTVLNSSANPILTQFDKVFGGAFHQETISCRHDNYDEWSMEMLIKSYDFDLKLLVQDMRKLFSSSSGYAKRKKKIETVYHRMMDEKNDGKDYIDDVRQLLMKN